MVMPKGEYEIFEALNPFFEVVMEGLRGLVDGDHYFDTIAEDAFFEFRYRFPGWPLTIRGRANLMASYSGYGKAINLHSGDALVVHRSQDSRVVILEYEVHGKILSGGVPYDNRFISVITIENRKNRSLERLHGLFSRMERAEWLHLMNIKCKRWRVVLPGQYRKARFRRFCSQTFALQQFMPSPRDVGRSDLFTSPVVGSLTR
jgi:ketosteroid isomerase-like protein